MSPTRFPFVRRLAWPGVLTWVLLGAGLAAAADPAPTDTASTEVATPRDRRLMGLKDLDGYFPMTVPTDKAAWEVRGAGVRRQMELALGLFPRPARPKLVPIVTGRTERDEYTIENVLIETSPGLFLTGNLYRPKPTAPGYQAALRTTDNGPAGGVRPVVLSPHGHGANGRFQDHGEAGVAKEIAAGAERFPIGGRYPEQARSVGLARMGIVVFEYDMLGYADGAPFTYEIIHRFAKQTPERSDPKSWGLFSAQAELRLVSAMGLQTWNSLAAVDYVLTLPEADPTRVGVTGASGGGTQSMILAALDERITASAPAVMVSTAMQGGCTCENASYLRIGTGNVEFAALAAPRPQALVAADDWTVDLETKGLPELKALYKLHGAENKIRGKYFPFPHNYNAVSRDYVYSFFDEVFGLKLGDKLAQRDFVPLTVAEGTVWTDEHPRPVLTPEREHEIVTAFGNRTELALAQSPAGSPLSRDEAVTRMGTVVKAAWRIMLGGEAPAGGLPDPATLAAELGEAEPFAEGATCRRGVLTDPADGRAMPLIVIEPAGIAPAKETVVVLTKDGIGSLRSADGKPMPLVAAILATGRRVVGTDLFLTGSLVSDKLPGPRAWDVPNPREAVSYTLGYNRPLLAERARDVATIVQWLAATGTPGKATPVHLIGEDGTGVVAAGAAVLSETQLATVAVDFQGFAFGTLTDITDERFLPGAVKYGDIIGLSLASSGVRLRAIEKDPIAVSLMINMRGSLAGRTEVVGSRLSDASPEIVAAWLDDRSE